MGEEITHSHFEPADFEAFGECLRRETALLKRWFSEGAFRQTANVGGFELEAWLVDAEARPANIIEPFLDALNDPLVVPELATFNVELNSSPRPLRGTALSRMASELDTTWAHCNRVARDFDARLAMIGILPSLERSELTLANMSPRQRYRALNDQILRLRDGQPLRLEIKGRDRIDAEHRDVMLESAATSFQIHLKINADEAVRFYNASKILSAPMVAVTANSPYLFGHDLWNETRIPLFEQSVSVGASDLTKRVSFGIRYAWDSIMECFDANLDRYPVLLPRVMEAPQEQLVHLRLHNGTIWRWNRPLIGFDADGSPHLRIEHRVVPSGPSVPDAIANAAFYYGAVCALAREPTAPEKRLPFERARTNFYRAARDGLETDVMWMDGKGIGIRELIRGILLPQARDGLTRLGLDADEIDHWLGIVEARVANGQTGAVWQRACVERRSLDMQDLTQLYLERQASGRPVHEWEL
jgi:hypothetical protein